MRPFSRASLAAVTAATMAVATFPQVMFGVLAADLIADFGVERWQVGALVTATALTGGVLSPTFGRVTDRVGAVHSTVGVLMAGTVSLTLVSLAPTYVMLFLVALLTAVPQGWANPATNALIVDNLESGARGVVTGIKQSGVQMGAFIGGLLLPTVATIWGWRAAIAAFLVVPFGALLAMWRRPEGAHHATAQSGGSDRVPRVVRYIAVYGGLAGLATSATFTFLPLFAEEDQGWTASQAGLLIAGVGLIGVVARITWGSVSERLFGHGNSLRLIGLMTTVSALLLTLASRETIRSWALIPAAILFGAGIIAWNAVGMLAVMDYSPSGLVGRGTGRVQLGFLLGLGTGAPLMGLSVDRLGVYWPGWLFVTALSIGCAFLGGRISRVSTLQHS
ncbi:MAG TPA: MFS transporter [Acidimicrobiia bacterium]|nr:MFS transporter [Acidimicrobiia bacterium]